MKRILFFLLLFYSRVCNGQTIDSIVVSNCKWFAPPDSGTSVRVDSFDVNHLLINSNSYYLSSDSTWNEHDRVLNTYSNSNFLLQQAKQKWIDTAWITYDETINQYDSDDSLIENYWFYYDYYSGALSFTQGHRYTYSRDTINHTTTTLYRNYVDSLARWDNSYLFLYKYDSLQRLSVQLRFYPDTSGNLVLNDSIEYFYLTNDSLDYFIQNSFTSLGLEQYNYNTDGFLFKILHNAWNYQTHKWDAKSFDQNYYDSSYNITASTWHMYIDTLIDWCGDSAAYQYDSFNHQIYRSFQSCGGGGSEGYSIYDNSEIIRHKHFCSWSHGGNYQCSDCDFTYFTAPFHNEVLEIERNNFQLYPNPATNSFTINNFSTNEKLIVVIVNVMGEIVYAKNLFGKNEYSVGADLAKGIYFVRVNDAVQKLIIE
jgi:hypothetical protein